MVKDFDKFARTGCSEEDDLVVCEHIKQRIHKSIDDLVLLLENREPVEGELAKPTVTSAPSRPAFPGGDIAEQWVTFTQAADIVCVSKATISNWATKGKIRDNGQRGQKRRLLKSDILLVRHEREAAELLRDAQEIREDAVRMENRH